MTDSKITKKDHPATGSLVRRILISAMLLLVIPLFLESFFLYKQEYEQKREDIEFDLKMLAGERAHFLDEMIQVDWRLLEMIPQSELLNSRNVKRLYIERIPLPKDVPNQFVVISQSRKVILAGVVESDRSALAIAIPFTQIGKGLSRAYPIRIALFNSQNQLLWESETGEEVLKAEEPVGETGLKLQLTIDESALKKLHLESYYYRFATLLFFVGVIGGGALFFFVRRIARPLRGLSEVMRRVSEGAAHARYTPDWMGFEINELGLQFNEALDGLLHHANEAEKERLHREKLAKELSIGHEIQSNLLPTHVPGFPGVDLATSYHAAKEVNGDFYDIYPLPSGKLLLAVCDTAGKGISACLFALGLRSILRTLASFELELPELVRRANDLYMADAHEVSMFSTLWIAIFEPKKRSLTYCSQGHPPALLIRGAQLEELWTEGIALGAQKIDVVPTKKITLEKGDLLFIYTDGLIEAHNRENRLFGKGRLYDILANHQKGSAQQIVDRIVEEVWLFACGAPQHDDMTLLLMHIQK